MAILTEGARSQVYEHPSYWPVLKEMYWWSKERLGSMTFMIASQYEITKDFYDKQHHSNPIKVNVNFVNLGKSSYQHYEESVSTITDKLLHTSIINYVYADLITKRPKKLPENFCELFKRKIPLEKVVPVTKPFNAYVVPVATSYSNLDIQLHVNQAQYLKFATDAGNYVCQKNGFTKLKDDLAKWKVKRITNLFLGENLPNEQIDVHVWEDENNPWMLHFYMEKEGKNVFQAMLEYYSD